MPHLRISRARRIYQCAECSTSISARQHYFRDEPHPFDRMRKGAGVRYLCLVCVLGEAQASSLLASLQGNDQQLPLGFEVEADGNLHFPPRVELVGFGPQMLEILAQDPEQLRKLTPEAFELLVCDRLTARGLDIQRVGSGTYQKDGGIDIIAWQRDASFPFLLAVQVKHTAREDRKIGPAPVRDLMGTVTLHGLNAGLLVANTTFTPDAQWVAAQKPLLLRLHDKEDLRTWLTEHQPRNCEWRGLPKSIQVCPGVVVTIPR